MAKLIDDFIVETPAVSIVRGTADHTYSIGESILGGIRRSTLGIGLNPYSVSANLDISDSYLKLSTDAGQFLGVDVVYGVNEDGHLQPLYAQGDGDFLAMGSIFRTNFKVGDGQGVPINYNIVVFTSGGVAHYGENVLPRAFGSIVIDFPFARFTSHPDSPADFSAVSVLLFRFQTWADFVIDSFEIV